MPRAISEVIGINRSPRSHRDRGREPGPRVNEQIRISEVRLISASGEQLGIVETRKALDMARTEELDLVEVAANSRPPVCRIMDYGKYKYEQSKKSKKGKTGSSQLKEIRLGLRISEHDYDFKMRHAENFLKQRHKVKITVVLRGRENAHRDQGRELLRRVEEDLLAAGTPEAPMRDEGRNMTFILAPK
jgi:translation initiation factor IF-3